MNCKHDKSDKSRRLQQKIYKAHQYGGCRNGVMVMYVARYCTISANHICEFNICIVKYGNCQQAMGLFRFSGSKLHHKAHRNSRFRLHKYSVLFATCATHAVGCMCRERVHQ